MNDCRNKLKSIGLSAAHIKSHLASVGVGLGYAVNDGRSLKLGKYHRDFDDQLTVGRGGVKRFLRGYKFYFMFFELLQDVHKV